MKKQLLGFGSLVLLAVLAIGFALRALEELRSEVRGNHHAKTEQVEAGLFR